MITDDRILRPAARRVISPARMVLATAPTVEPWLSSDDEVQQGLRLDSDADDAYVGLVLKAARQHFERVTGLALITQTWRAEFDGLPAGRELQLSRVPLLGVTEVNYRAETTGTLTLMSSADYSVAGVGVNGAFGRLWLNEDADWPALGSFPAALQVTFTAGFGAAATDVPDDIRTAVLFLAAHWYENRLPVGPALNEMPLHLQDMLETHRVAFLA